MVQDKKHVIVHAQIDERVRVNPYRDPTVINDPPSLLFVQMACTRTFRPPRWARLDLEYPQVFTDSSSSLERAVNVTMVIRLVAAIGLWPNKC